MMEKINCENEMLVAEEAVDNQIADAVQSLLGHLQSERLRIVQKSLSLVQSMNSAGDHQFVDSDIAAVRNPYCQSFVSPIYHSPSVYYRRNSAFDELISRLLKTPFGDFKASTAPDEDTKLPQRSKEKASTTDEETKRHQLTKEKTTKTENENEDTKDNQRSKEKSKETRHRSSRNDDSKKPKLYLASLDPIDSPAPAPSPSSSSKKLAEVPVRTRKRQVSLVFDEKSPTKRSSSKSKAKSEGESGRRKSADDDSRKNKYKNLQIVAVVKGADCFGDLITKPSCIAAMNNCFVIMHNDRISLLTPLGGVKATFKMQTDAGLDNGHNYLRFVAVDPFTGNLIVIDRGEIKSVQMTPSVGSHRSIVDAKTRIGFSRAPFGLAVSVSARLLFTTTNGDICAYSLLDWTPRGKWPIEDSSAAHVANMVGSHNDKLYIVGHGGRTLNAVPFDASTGQAATGQMKTVARDFIHLRGVTFDAEDNIIVAHKGNNTVEVLSADGRDKLAVVAGPDSSFNPHGVAILTAEEGEEPYMFVVKGNKTVRCSSIIASPDYTMDRIVYFGCPLA